MIVASEERLKFIVDLAAHTPPETPDQQERVDMAQELLNIRSVMKFKDQVIVYYQKQVNEMLKKKSELEGMASSFSEIFSRYQHFYQRTLELKRECTVYEMRIAALEAERCWIPIKERIPNKSQQCLFFDTILGKQYGSYHFFLGMFLTEDNDVCQNVTHWMDFDPGEPGEK
jgi:hypothetical protein